MGAGLDEEALALRLLEPAVPHPLEERSVWRGVHAVGDGWWLRLDQDGSARCRQWWTTPEPELPLARGAHSVRAALGAAVAARTAGGGTISADLSGGMDSTSLCFLAAGGHARLLTCTRTGGDSSHGDAAWARQVPAHLPRAEHLLMDCADLPPFFAGMLAFGHDADEPVRGARAAVYATDLARRMAAAGSRLHLCGEAADQVVQGFPSYLHTAVRTAPTVAMRHLRALAAHRRWQVVPMVRALADSRTYPRWLAATAGDLPPLWQHSGRPAMGWQLRPGMPPWASDQAVATVRGLIRDAAPDARPLAGSRGQHTVLMVIRSAARIARHLAGITADAGTPTHFPYLDDQVIDACLAVRLHERTSPFVYKPLLAAAMRTIVPDVFLGRRTKGEFTLDVHTGLRQRRASSSRSRRRVRQMLLFTVPTLMFSVSAISGSVRPS
nr:asparagine synthase-related protein [Streptomyces hainanensis]